MSEQQTTPIEFIQKHIELEQQGISIDWKTTAIKLAQAVTPQEQDQTEEA